MLPTLKDIDFDGDDGGEGRGEVDPDAERT